MILIRGVPWAIQLLQLKIFLDDMSCKIIIYLQRVSWSISLCSTCLLSVFQAITISSRNTRWTELKARAPKYIIPFCILLWILILVSGVAVFFHVTGPWNSTYSKHRSNLEFCSLNRYTMTTSTFVIWKSLYEGVFVGFIVITSGYMILVLYKHHQEVWQNLGTSLSPRTSPEIRATKAILLLVSIFLYFYSFCVTLVKYLKDKQGYNE
ncbi:vomeronasal type-1 receptor 3-like [Petaurus breviceps papuanus]|uniref:vomeronasal type-1 receptor 3-like n=1 Tax=Petaurus breviceps papuanus TaxID=3040969 RepID=UPI0036D88B73